ncbi:MAG: phosphatidylglycerol lysyltransferase domain-containing protein [Actinomycetes bacterium]
MQLARGLEPDLGPVVGVAASNLRAWVRTQLDRHGRSAGQYSALGPDPWQILPHLSEGPVAEEVGFSAVLEGRWCSVVWRGPVIDPTNDPLALQQLQDRAHATHRQLVVLGADDSMQAAGVSLGFRQYWLGTECFVALPEWNMDGGRRSKLRWARSHAASTCWWREASPTIDLETQRQMLEVEQTWKNARAPRSNDSFLRTSLLEIADVRRYFVCVQRAPSGAEQIIAYVAVTPLNERSWYLQDCVRLPTAVRGALEGALVLALDTLRDAGFAEASNGVLPMWAPDGAPYSRPSGPVIHTLINQFDRRYRFSGLNQFRLKVEPDRTVPAFALIWPPRLSPRAAASLTRLTTRAAPTPLDSD